MGCTSAALAVLRRIRGLTVLPVRHRTVCRVSSRASSVVFLKTHHRGTERQPDKTPLEIGGHYRQVPSTCSKRREARKLSARPPSRPCCALGARRGAKRPASGQTDAELPMDPLDIVTARARSTAVPVASVLRRFPSALGAVPQRQHDAAPPLAPAPRITHDHTQLQRLPWARAHAPAARRAAFCAF